MVSEEALSQASGQWRILLLPALYGLTHAPLVHIM